MPRIDVSRITTSRALWRVERESPLVLLPNLDPWYIYGGRREIGISGSLIWSETLMELIFNPYGDFRWSPEVSVSQFHSPRLHAEPLGSFKMMKREREREREWGATSNGKLPHLFIPSKTATLVPEFAVEYLLLCRSAALVPEFAVKYLLLGRTLSSDIQSVSMLRGPGPIEPSEFNGSYCIGGEPPSYPKQI